MDGACADKWLLVALLGLLGAAPVRAGDPTQDPDHTMARAGWPEEISPIAHPSDTGSYTGYMVGGGSPCHGTYPPAQACGTWGWDYSGCRFHRNVVLRWWNRSHYQGGTGAYQTDGPRFKHEAQQGE